MKEHSQRMQPVTGGTVLYSERLGLAISLASCARNVSNSCSSVVLRSRLRRRNKSSSLIDAVGVFFNSPTDDVPYIPTFYGMLVPITVKERHLVEEFIYQVDHDDTPPEPQTFLFTLELD